MLRRQHHEGDAEDGIGAGGKDPDFFFFYAGMVQGEGNFRALALADPVALHDLDALRPVDAVILQQLVGVFGDAEKPLLQVALDHFGVAAPALAVDHLLVSEHHLALGAPVDRRLGRGRPGPSRKA